ncbi:hypothetical protein AAMO2058_000098100 [Amorphochlora amoebiformis]
MSLAKVDLESRIRKKTRAEGREGRCLRNTVTGHTMRIRSVETVCQPRVLVVQRDIQYKDGLEITPVTVVDVGNYDNPYTVEKELARKGGIKDPLQRMHTGYTSHSNPYPAVLRKQKGWDKLKMFEEESVKRKIGICPFSRQKPTVFTVPVIGHVITRVDASNKVEDMKDIEEKRWNTVGGQNYINPEEFRCKCISVNAYSRRCNKHRILARTVMKRLYAKKKFNGACFFKVQGKLFSSDFKSIYSYDSRTQYCRELFSLNHPELPKGVFPLRVQKATGSRPKPGLHVSKCIVLREARYGKDCDHWSPVDNKRGDDALILDLGRNMDITHVSTMGHSLSLTRRCLGSCPQGHIRTRGSRLPWKNCRSNCVTFLNALSGPIVNHCVLSYALYIRKEGAREWLPIGTFNGNTDVKTEVLHKIGSENDKLSARYLKFEPKTFQGSKSMRVGVYGREDMASKEKKVIAQKTVSYTVEKPHSARYNMEKHGNAKFRYVEKRKANRIKRKEMRNRAKESGISAKLDFA